MVFPFYKTIQKTVLFLPRKTVYQALFPKIKLTKTF